MQERGWALTSDHAHHEQQVRNTAVSDSIIPQIGVSRRCGTASNVQERSANPAGVSDAINSMASTHAASSFTAFPCRTLQKEGCTKKSEACLKYPPSLQTSQSHKRPSGGTGTP